MIADSIRNIVTQRRVRLTTHPNGYIQMPVTGHTRLHVFPDIEIAKRKTFVPIHDHRCDFESDVLLGEIDHAVYRVAFIAHGSYMCHFVQGRRPWLQHADAICAATVATLTRVRAGETYALPARVMHEIRWTGLAVTLLTKIANYPNIQARVLVPIGVEPDNDFDRETANAQEVLWAIVDRAVARVR